MKKYKIEKSTIHAKGVILAKNIEKDETIFVFRGKEVLYTGGAWQRKPNCLQVGYVRWIDPAPNSAGRFLNHSCSPTAGVRGKNTIVAIRDLQKGEEVTIDYALSETYPMWHMRCRCKSSNCRKFVKPYQDLSDQRKYAYRPYTSKYILDMKLDVSWKEYLQKKSEKRQSRQ